MYKQPSRVTTTRCGRYQARYLHKRMLLVDCLLRTREQGIARPYEEISTRQTRREQKRSMLGRRKKNMCTVLGMKMMIIYAFGQATQLLGSSVAFLFFFLGVWGLVVDICKLRWTLTVRQHQRLLIFTIEWPYTVSWLVCWVNNNEVKKNRSDVKGVTLRFVDRSSWWVYAHDISPQICYLC